MKYTPRQMYFMLELVTQRKMRETYHNLSMTALACQGSERSIKKQLQTLKKAIK